MGAGTSAEGTSFFGLSTMANVATVLSLFIGIVGVYFAFLQLAGKPPDALLEEYEEKNSAFLSNYAHGKDAQDETPPQLAEAYSFFVRAQTAIEDRKRILAKLEKSDSSQASRWRDLRGKIASDEGELKHLWDQTLPRLDQLKLLYEASLSRFKSDVTDGVKAQSHKANDSDPPDLARAEKSYTNAKNEVENRKRLLAQMERLQPAQASYWADLRREIDNDQTELNDARAEYIRPKQP